MVMEASPSPQSVGREFVRQYYTLLNQAPSHLHRFYNNYSSFVHGGLDAPHRETLPVIGQKQIHNQIQQLNFRDCHAKISQVDAQATLGNGVVVQVSGELSNRGAPMRRFTQTFVLAAQSPKKYYVHNDIFRYQDIVVCDEDAEPEHRSSSEDEEPPRSYFAPPASAFPAPSAFAHEEINGHADEEHREAESSSGAVAGNNEVEAEPEPEPEPEAEPEPEPLPEPPVSNEPKTYANLLKCGPTTGTGRVMSMPAYSAPPPPQPIVEQPAPVVKPLDAKPRRERREPREGRDNRERERDRDTRERDRDARGERDVAGSQLFVGNVPTGATEAQLKVLFAKFGPVVEVRLVGRGVPNYGFVTFAESRSAKSALGASLFFPGEGGTRLNLEEKKPRPRTTKHHAPAHASRR